MEMKSNLNSMNVYPYHMSKAASLIGRAADDPATSVCLVCEDGSSNVSMAARQPRQ
jgi:hypothetical protein